MSDTQSDNHGKDCRCKYCERVFVYDEAKKYDVDEAAIWVWIKSQRALNRLVDYYSIHCYAFNLAEFKKTLFHERNAREGITAKEVKHE